MTKITDKWREMGELYKKFCPSEFGGDFSEEAALEMFLHESTGAGKPGPKNGYAQGKKWMNVTVEMWRKDIPAGLLYRCELYQDFPREWVDSVLTGVYFDQNKADALTA
jgi:hypothetical protein